MKKTKIVCTIGPASDSVETLVKMIEAGMNVARLNFSHGNYDEHKKKIRNIREASRLSATTIGLMLDTKGPEIRTHAMEDDAIELKMGDTLIVSIDEVLGTPEKISLTYPQLIEEVEPGDKILLDDGLMTLEVTEIDNNNNNIVTKVSHGGILKSNKGVNVPGVKTDLPGLTEKDRQDIMFGLEYDVDFIAPSFVRNSDNVLEIREILSQYDKEYVQIIPKIENQEGVDNIDEILSVSDGIMVGRGDLGVEIPIEDVPIVQKQLIEKCNALGKPVITATQMLESMQEHPQPTRAESNDVANAIYDGSDSIMLSGETAAGKYPIEAVKMMSKIALRSEKAQRKQASSALAEYSQTNTTDAIGQATGHTAKNLGIKTIVAATNSGYTARMISKYRPNAHIVAVTFDEKISRTLTLQWGVEPVVAEVPASTDDMFALATDIVIEKEFAREGDLILITAGVPVGEKGTTNLMKIQMIGQRLIEAQGIGEHSVSAKTTIALTAQEANDHMEEGNILVTSMTDKNYLPALEQASGIIVEHGGLTSHAAVVGIAMGIPVIVRAENATQILQNGELITLDARRGLVYRGETMAI